MDGQHDARPARKRLQIDGMPLTASKQLRMDADIEQLTLKNIERVETDAKLPTQRKEKHA
jgi:hypothetical protein